MLVVSRPFSSAFVLGGRQGSRQSRGFAVVPGHTPPVTSHLSLVPLLLRQTLKVGDVAVDATAGNGHDSLTLAKLVLCEAGVSGRVFSFDVQADALRATRLKILEEFSEIEVADRVTQFHANHKEMALIDKFLPSGTFVNAFTYNLGYLPGGDKSQTTIASDTVLSLQLAAERTAPGGLICVTCYVSHEGGKEETEAVRNEMSLWPQSVWRICEHRPLNWPTSPILITAHKFEVFTDPLAQS
jgi:hypothetical protein